KYTLPTAKMPPSDPFREANDFSKLDQDVFDTAQLSQINRMRRHFFVLILATAASSSVRAIQAAPAPTVGGYRGIWYSNQSTRDEYKFKYSGGFATYPQQHVPIAIYSATTKKTFFVYGGSTGKPKELACMVSYFDHATRQVPRPRVVLIKKTDDAHENPTLS